ncbi:MAG: electron transfer flavoprotein subunit beta/FixA family protein [Planctomycetota bacterium]
MKIAVCLKRVPDTAAKIRVAADGKSIDETDLQFVISPYDEYAVEEGIRLKERFGEASVTVITLGPDAAQQNIRQALAMGADNGILIQTPPGASFDPYQTARNLAATLKERGDDLILFGRQSVDDQSGQVGPMTARLLGMPCVSEVTKLDIEDGRARIEREVEGGREILEASLPLAVGAQKGLNEPRYASLKGIMAAKKKPIEVVPAEEVERRLDIVSLDPPPGRPEGRIVGEGVEAVTELVRLLREEAKAI